MRKMTGLAARPEIAAVRRRIERLRRGRASFGKQATFVITHVVA